MDGFRYEQKYLISLAGYRQLKTRLDASLCKDSHIQHADGAYFIRSLYFDDYKQSGLRDKMEGIEKREKFRIRFYDMDDSFIRLECKQKIEQLTRKLSVPLTREQAERLINGDIFWMTEETDAVFHTFYLKSRTQLLRPTVLVDYYREPYVFQDVRITFDRDIRSGRYATNLFDPAVVTVPILPSNQLVLEVKYDEALPYAVKQLLKTVPLTRSAVSKYALCRQWQ